MAISGLPSALPALPSTSRGVLTESPEAPGFGDTLKRLLNTVETKAGDANQAVSRMLDGTGDVHEAMIAMQEAHTMLEMTVQIRNKLVQAYQDVMRMPV